MSVCFSPPASLDTEDAEVTILLKPLKFNAIW
jgi:hypothetical protein